MPIRTIHNGALVFVMLVAGALATMSWSVETVSAKTPVKRVTKQVTKTRATKGVRTKTANQKRRPRTAVAKAKAAERPSLPAEVPGDGSSTAVVDRALSILGSRYRWGGTSPTTGFDCSGLIHYLFGEKAGNLPRSSHAMYQSISKTNELRPGDIVFFGRGRVRHAAIYVGGGQVVHASTPRSGVRKDSVSTLSRALGYMGAGRII